MAKNKSYDTGVSQLSASFEMIRSFYPIIAIGILIVIILSVYMVNRDMVEPDIFLQQTTENYYAATAKISKKDEQKVLTHLKELKDSLPKYIKQYVVRDTDSIAATITVRYAVDDEALGTLYYLDSVKYKEIKSGLIDKGYEIE